MVQQFNAQTPVIRLPIHIDDHEVQNNKKSWLLLPTVMYKILLPTANNKELNLFQDTILKLLRSGYKSPEQLAAMLHLGIDLVNYVLQELVEKKLIASNGTLTQAGMGYFSSQSTVKETKIGYIFYDMLTKQFWNQVLLDEDLVYVDTEFERNRATLQLGSLDSPKPQKALVMKASDNKIAEVRPEIVYQTVKNSVARLNNLSRLKSRYREIKLVDDNKNLENIKMISSGDFVYLPTFMYLPINIKQNSHWQVLHPFGETNSTEILDELQKMRHQYEPLNRTIDQLLKTALDTVKPSIEEQDKEIYKYVLSVYGNKIERKHVLLQSTIQFIRTFKKVKQLLDESNRGAIFEDLQIEFSAFVVHAIELFEDALYTIQQGKKRKEKQVNAETVTIDVKQYAKKDARQNLKMLHTLAIKSGFEMNADVEAYGQLLKMRAGDIIHGYSNRNLKGLLAVALIESGEQTNYPLRQLAKKFPTFLDFVQNLLTLRNLSAHLNEDTFETNSSEDMFSKTMYTISVLFDFMFNHDLLEQYGGLDEASLMADRKLRLLSKQYVQNEFGQTLEDQPLIEKLLSEMHYFKNNHPDHYVMKSVSVIEYLLNTLLIDFDYLNAPQMPEEPSEALSKIAQNATDYGFTFDVANLPESFVNFNIHKVTIDLLSLKKSVPNTKLYALLFLIGAQKDEKWRKMAEQMPQMFEQMIKLIDLRKHGNVTIDPKEMQTTEQFIYELIKVSLPYQKKQRT